MKLNFLRQKTAFYEFYLVIGSWTRNLKIITLQLLLSFLILASVSIAQTKSFSFTEIPFSDPDIIAPFRGSEIWYNEFTIQLPTGTGTNINPQGSGYVGTMNQYWRFPWRAIQNDDGSYNWTVLDSIFRQAIRNKRKLGIGIMQLGGSFGASTVGGKYLTYPLFVHNQMQGEANPDYPDGDGYPGYNQWYPNVNSNFYQSAWANMLLAVANRINSTSYLGILYSDVLQYVDIRGHGFYGEWNGYNASTKPAAMSSALVATPASLIKLVDAAKNAFPNHQLVAPIGAYYGDQGTDSGSPPEVGYYILTTSNNFGKIGVRRDHWGQNSFWMPNFFENNNSKFNGIVFKDSLMARWKIAPILGEPTAADAGGGGGADGPVPYYDLPRQIRFYHATSFGNGNYGGYNVSGNTQLRDSVRMASKLSGYRLAPNGGTMTDIISSNAPFSITVNWKNNGVAPVYDNWNIWYELRDATEKVIWSAKSSFNLRLFLPASNATPHVDNFTLPAISGTGLKLVMIIKDPKNYLSPLPLAVTGRQADGSYILRTGISIQTGTPSNQAPTANAGADQVITLPITSATISGSGSDVDGTIASFNWTKINGPAGATIESANTASTKINGLAEGQYTYRLTVTDNAGASTSDDINIIVNKASGTVTNGISVNAGNDQVITLPQNSVTLVSNGSKTSTASPDVNLILIWGESNASGAAPNNQGPTAAELAPRSAVKVLNNSNLTFENIDIGTNHNIDNYSSLDVHAFELGLTNEVEAGRLAGPVYLVKAAKSGSRIDEWQPGQEWWNKMKLRMDAAVASLKSQGKTYQITIWASIGLNDFVQNTTAADYMSRMQNFYSSFRALYGSNVVALQTRFVSYHPYNTTINAIDAADPNTYAIDVNGAPFLDQDVHWNYDGYKLIANRMVTTMLSISPTVSTTLNYVWSKVSGPTGETIKTPNSATTDISGLKAGTYVFRNTVTDNIGGTAFDDVQIIVNPDLTPSPPNQLPFVTAGNDQTITLPANTTTLNGSATDPDGTIASYAWSKVSGPAGGNLQSANTASTNVTGLNAGTYVFRLTVTDNTGAIATDDISILVNTSLAPSPTNQAPIANAGSDINITLPANSAALSGAGTDADGTVSSYAWSKVSGPTGGNIQTANTASTSITGLSSGTYVFRLTVTDNAGAQATDDVKVIVTAAPPVAGNQAPTANAGSNQSITLPVNSVTLSGSGNDADGSITSFAWAKISGPAGGIVQAPSAANSVISGLVAGTYTYRITVTDNAGATATDDVQIIVNAAPIVPNTAPNANAGHDISITLPTNSATLNGTASIDPDGSIVSYGWRKIQGPAGSSFTSTNIASPTVNGLTRGQYEFELTVTDNRGASSTDRVLVTVIKINQKPVAKLTRDTISVALPVQNAELSAINSYDPDGVITNYEWTYKKGPKDPKMLSPQSSKTIIADLITGTYEFDLVVTDDDGAMDKKAVVVIVKNGSSRRLIPDVSVYPNPASNLVNVKISTDIEGRTSLTFIDMNGRPVMTDVFVKGYGSYTRQVNIGRIPKGTYTILIQVDQTEKVVEKLIKF